MQYLHNIHIVLLQASFMIKTNNYLDYLKYLNFYLSGGEYNGQFKAGKKCGTGDMRLPGPVNKVGQVRDGSDQQGKTGTVGVGVHTKRRTGGHQRWSARECRKDLSWSIGRTGTRAGKTKENGLVKRKDR
jgi:hypothetical protein